MKYRKKPVEIEAVQFFGEDSYSERPRWIRDAIENGTIFVSDKYDRESKTVIEVTNIRTLEGDHIVSQGDFIIQGVAGELYPCKADIFERTYERVSAF